MKHIIEHGTTFLHLSGPASIENREPRKLNFWHAGTYHTIHQSEMRELLPYLQAFAETGALPPPPEPEKTPLELLLERVNAVPRPRFFSEYKWSTDLSSIRIGEMNTSATIMLDRGGATMLEAMLPACEMIDVSEYIERVADIVRRHYDDEAICAVLNAVPGKPVLFHADSWKRKPGADRISLGSKTPHLYVTSDVVWMSHKCLSDAAIAGYKKEFDGYMYAISKAFKGFYANSTR